MSAATSMLTYLNTGRQVTTRAARTMFKVQNVADVIYRLRNEGHVIYTNRVTTSRGEQTFAYRMGQPSQRYTSSMKSRHLARARRALYQEAITATA